jgi:hypothetical protein
MRTLALLVIHILTTLAKRLGPAGAKAIIAERVLVKHQQLIARRSVGKNAQTDHIRQIPLRLSGSIHVTIGERILQEPLVFISFRPDTA